MMKNPSWVWPSRLPPLCTRYASSGHATCSLVSSRSTAVRNELIWNRVGGPVSAPNCSCNWGQLSRSQFFRAACKTPRGLGLGAVLSSLGEHDCPGSPTGYLVGRTGGTPEVEVGCFDVFSTARWDTRG